MFKQMKFPILLLLVILIYCIKISIAYTELINNNNGYIINRNNDDQDSTIDIGSSSGGSIDLILNNDLFLETSYINDNGATSGGASSNEGSGGSSDVVVSSNTTIIGNITGGPIECTSCTSDTTVYLPNYLCITNQTNWQNVFTFHDPIPSNQLIIVHKIFITITGIFQVSGDAEGIVIVLLNDDDTADITPIEKSTPSSQCKNCQTTYQPGSVYYSMPSYKYGDDNTISLNLFNIPMACIGKIQATLFYGPVDFKVNSVYPNISSSLGGDVVTFIGEKFYNTTGILCKFGSVTSPGTYNSPTNITCIVPPMANSESMKPSDYNVTIQLSEDDGASYCAPTTYFIYSVVSIPMKQPQNYQKLIWTIVGVSIAVFLIIAVGIYFIIKLRLKNKKLNNSRHALPIGINDDERSPLLKTDYKTLFEIKPIDISEIVVQNRIGRGSCAEVFTGTWRGIIVAIKKAKLLNEDDEDFLNELAQEATIMSQLRHPNICQFLGTCNNPPEILIVMEYMPLGSLYRILHDPTIQLDWPRMKSMALDIAKGMNYLHCCDPIVIHRDLKSHNLLVDEHFRVKISDFGLSTRFKKHLDKKTAMTPVGTPCWTAPEVLRNDTYTEKADVFSFAIVLWEIVTREDPYQGMPTFQIVISVGQHKLRPIVPPQVSAPFTRLITECWSEDPQQRPSFQEIVKRLEAM